MSEPVRGRAFRPRRTPNAPLSVAPVLTVTTARPQPAPIAPIMEPASAAIHSDSDGLYDSEGEIYAVLTDQDHDSDSSSDASQPHIQATIVPLPRHLRHSQHNV